MPEKHIYCKVFGFDEWLKKYKAQILLSMITNPDIQWCDCISYNEDFEDDNRLIVHRYHRNEEEIEKAKIVLDYWIENLKNINKMKNEAIKYNGNLTQKKRPFKE